MVLLLDHSGERLVFGALGGRKDKWLRTPPVVGGFGPLAKAFKAFGLRRRPPRAVVAALYDRAAGAPHVPWSVVRAAVAAANTLAFAWNVPVAAIRLSGRESRDEVAALALAAAAKAPPGEWISAVYSGEPNISKAKKVI